MSKSLRRFALLAAAVAVALPLSATASSGQTESELTLTVKKVVVGTGAPSTVTVSCEGAQEANALDTNEFLLNFDAQGNPTTSLPGEFFVIEDGAWVAHAENGSGGTCTFTETTTGGATATAWTCDYDFVPFEIPQAEQIQLAGCQAASGSGVGPATVLYPSGRDVVSQESTVTFTNTFTPAPPVVAAVVVQPAFTG